MLTALIDSTHVVYGRTYALPQQGVIGDIAVDAARGNVFLSNTAFNLLDVWQSSATAKGFAPNSDPGWLIALGHVHLEQSRHAARRQLGRYEHQPRLHRHRRTPRSIREDLANRILTRNTYVFTVTVQQDENTGKIRLTGAGPFSYSDRPQYLVQSKGGRIFYLHASDGDRARRQHSLARSEPAGSRSTPDLAVRHHPQVDGSDLRAFSTSTPWRSEPRCRRRRSPDTLFIWDHPYGQKTGTVAVFDTIPLNAVAAAVAGGSDAEAVLRLDIASLPLTDTTFTAASGNRTWVAFGEGHQTGAGRVIMVADSTGPMPNFFSPLVTILDLTDNASEQVFGLALDLHGATVASHGSQSFFSTVSDPFHLRLQGKYDSFDNGAGIAFHPNATGTLTPMDQRLAFVGGASGVIEVVDIAYYINRGRLQLKNTIYGALRASGPMPGDSPDVVMKLYAVSPQGLVVIDLTANDIKPGPP